jgi:amino acid efflux transporter
MTLVFWAFLGWENLSFTTEEFENIKRDFKRVVMLSFIIMMCLYLGLSAGVITWLDSSSSRTMSAPLAEVIYVALGYRSGIAVAIIAVLIMLININAWVWGPSRLVYDAGRKKIIPDKLANLNRHHSPHYALYILFIFYTISLLLIYLMGDKFMLIAIKQVNCIFLLLYILSIMGYLKSCNTLFHKTVGLLAMGLFILFLLQFGLYLILPVIFFVLIFIKNHFQKNIYKKRVKQGF